MEMYFILGLIAEYYKNDRVIEKDMHGRSIHKTIILSSNIDEITDEILESLIVKYDQMYNDMEERIFSFKFIYSLNTRCKKVNVLRGAPFIRSPY